MITALLLLRTNHKWTDGERDIVRRDYDGTGGSVNRIAARLGVSLYSVKGQIQRLGLARIHHNRWALNEEEDLAELIERYSITTTARKMHRSVNSVSIKAKRLKLSRRSRFECYTKKEVCEILGVDHKRIQRYIDEGLLKAQWNSEIEPQKNGMAYWRIYERDLRNFIIKYAGEFQGRNVDLWQVVNILTGGGNG